jgi:probable phosphoglycerate mutase
MPDRAQGAIALFEGNRLRVAEFPHRLIFLRHGETAYNAENRLQGQRDIPLNARGREQARAVGQTLGARIGSEIDRLEAAGAFIASPLERARETMDIARDAMGLPPSRYRLDPVLKEISFGAWEGLTWPEIEARDPKGVGTRRKDKWSFVPPRGESYAMLAARLSSWLDGLVGDAFVVSHGGVARALMALIAGVAPAKAADAPIAQGRALCFENGGCHWIT